jgi:hypothetical protein
VADQLDAFGRERTVVYCAFAMLLVVDGAPQASAAGDCQPTFEA